MILINEWIAGLKVHVTLLYLHVISGCFNNQEISLILTISY